MYLITGTKLFSFLRASTVSHLHFHVRVGEQSAESVGLFRNLLKLRVSCGNEVFKNHLQTSGRNAQYASAPIQNELNEACGKVSHKKNGGRGSPG